MDLREAGHPVGEAAGVVGLVAVVELLEDARRELGDDACEADLARDRQPPLRDLGELLDDAEVRLGLGRDPRSLDLDRDERPVVQRRPVDLGRGRGGERLVLERGVQGLGRARRAPS